MIMIASTLIERERTHAAPDLLLHHLTERLPAAPHGREKHDHVMHATAERRADQNPKRARQITKLRREHRTHQRSRAGDGRKVMTESHPAIGRHEILAVFLHDRGRGPLVVQHEHLYRQPPAVETVADRQSAHARR